MYRIRLRLMSAAILLLAADLPSALAQDGPGKGYAQVPQGAYSIIAEVKARPGREAELRAVTLPLIGLVRGDPKNLVYFLQESRERPGHFIFYEVFATREDFEAPDAMPYVKEWFARIADLAEGGVAVRRMEILAEAR